MQSNGSKRARTVVPAGRLKQTITESHKAQDTLFFNSPQQSHTQSRQSQNEIKTETVTHASRQADTGRHSQNEIKTETVTRGTRHAIHLPLFPTPLPSTPPLPPATRLSRERSRVSCGSSLGGSQTSLSSLGSARSMASTKSAASTTAGSVSGKKEAFNKVQTYFCP